MPIYFWPIGDICLCSASKDEGKRYAKLVFNEEIKEDAHIGYFLLLRSGTRIKPRNEPLKPKELKLILQANLAGSVKRRFFNAIKRKVITADSREYLIIGIPQPNGATSLVGVEFSDFHPQGHQKNMVIRHPLYKCNCSVKMIPLEVERHYREHLLNRTGGDYGLQAKKVVILGVGAVGSRIAGELLKAGVNDLTLIDKDIFLADNLYRHELGAYHLYRSKAKAVTSYLKMKYPLTFISSQDADVHLLLSTYPDMFERFDLVISALGNPTIEMLLNQKIHCLNKTPAIIFAWVEPLGIGGHALCTLNNNQNGCYECLHTAPSAPTIKYENRASFAAPNQVFSKSVSGCGTQFTPYSSLDALQTAILATRLAIDVLIGKEKDNPLLSWKGDVSNFLENGFLLSKRYDFSQEQLYEFRYAYKTKRCPICNAPN